jgi:hypothetical protein
MCVVPQRITGLVRFCADHYTKMYKKVVKLFVMHCSWFTYVKGKAVLLHAMEALEGRGYIAPYSFLTSALDGGEWSASRPGHAFTPGEKTPGTHWTGGWVGPRAGLDTEDRGKILCPRRESNLDRPVVQPVVRHYRSYISPPPKRLHGV